jgi:hypothetical protein
MTTIDLPLFEYNKENISSESINAFNLSTRDNNDKNNKTRENIIGAIMNGKVPNEFYEIPQWIDMKNNILSYISEVTNNKKYKKIECEHRGGRKYKYDFDFKIYYDDDTENIYNIEFKFNTPSIAGAPQYVSPMNPSQYMINEMTFEENHYKKYLPEISKLFGGLPIPPLEEEYLKQVGGDKPKCMKPYQDNYYKGSKQSSRFTNNEEDIRLYEECKKISYESIKNYINESDLNIEKLSKYLVDTQKNKKYMLYYDNKFILQTVNNLDDYIIESVTKTANTYNCVSKSGKNITILLRWKNGNGIAFPAFQIN